MSRYLLILAIIYLIIGSLKSKSESEPYSIALTCFSAVVFAVSGGLLVYDIVVYSISAIMSPSVILEIIAAVLFYIFLSFDTKPGGTSIILFTYWLCIGVAGFLDILLSTSL